MLGEEYIVSGGTYDRYIQFMNKLSLHAKWLNFEERELANQKYQLTDAYAAQMKFSWKIENGPIEGSITSVEWTGYFNIKQTDGKYKLIKSSPIKLDFSKIKKEDYNLAKEIIIKAFTSGVIPKEISKIDKNISNKFLPTDKDLAIKKYNEVSESLLNSNSNYGLKQFVEEIEFELIKSLMDV